MPDGTGEAPRRRGGIGAWARRLTGARGDAARQSATGAGPGAPAGTAPLTGGTEAWPDPAAVLLTALGPGPRLWERAAGHPEALTVRLGTTERAELAAVPVTVGLREAGSLGLAGPRPRLLGLARSVLAQLTALHAPADLEVVLVSADPARPLEQRVRDWGWLGWLPHVRPAHGQDCRLLLAYDPGQAAARADELTRRLDDGPLGPHWASAPRAAVEEAAARYGGPQAPGPYTVVVVDGDPGTGELRETVARLAGAGAAAGIHLVCLAETTPASALSPLAATYEAACAASPAFRECGAVGLLSGDVATALRVMRAVGGGPPGTARWPRWTRCPVRGRSASPAPSRRCARSTPGARPDGGGAAAGVPAAGRAGAGPGHARVADGPLGGGPGRHGGAGPGPARPAPGGPGGR
ncbi:hypothetical protein [Streptomyces sp. CC228A]|uniref:hypothetical protein n=1 Tax=Streptomyces sp. CC228A TaxID=2898186 RepID=UPI0035A907C4